MKISKRQSRLLGFGILGLFFVVASLIISANQADPPIIPPAQEPDAEGESSPTSADADNTSSFQLREFHRSETRDGKVIWEVRGENAKLLPQGNSVQVEQGHLTFLSRDGDPVQIRAKRALLQLAGAEVRRADTSEGVELQYSDRVTATTDEAVYLAEEQLVTAPGHVTITGDPLEVQGTGLRADLENQEITILADVTSVIQPRSQRKEKKTP